MAEFGPTCTKSRCPGGVLDSFSGDVLREAKDACNFTRMFADVLGFPIADEACPTLVAFETIDALQQSIEGLSGQVTDSIPKLTAEAGAPLVTWEIQ